MFPKEFVWGAATAAYQVEGSPLADGAGPTTWHEFTHKRGRIRDGTTGDIACDHYNRYQQDIGHMQELGLKAYRFSVGWGRIFPEPGRPNQKGLDFYDRLVDSLLSAGIQPWLTIFHMEEPLWLARRGGFVRREAVDFLVELGTLLFRKLGDRVHHWITVNEPTIHASSGYLVGEFPPARRLAFRSMMHCIHHLLLSHSRLCTAWEAAGMKGMIGLAHHSAWVSPANPARQRDLEAATFMDEMANGSVLDPILRGTFPARALKRMRLFLPRSLERDLEEMKKPGTYIGINYYTRTRYRWANFVPFMHLIDHVPHEVPRSAMWEIYPPGIYQSLMRLKEEYGNPPSVITENGFPLPERPGMDPLDDQERISYLRDHIRLMGKAISDGADCRGYFAWSLMDNFEWRWGLSMRFGLLRTDFSTLERQWKKSASWYRQLVHANGLEADA